MSDSYVTQSAWSEPVGRPDAIDDVADQFERPADPGGQAFWSPGEIAGWPRASRGWPSIDRLHPRTVERRAG